LIDIGSNSPFLQGGKGDFSNQISNKFGYAQLCGCALKKWILAQPRPVFMFILLLGGEL
jgi:hypothetical protein